MLRFVGVGSLYFLLTLFLNPIFLIHTAMAQEDDYEYTLYAFDEPLTTTRGSIAPQSQDGFYLSREEQCRFTVRDWGWANDGCEYIDQLVFDPFEGVSNLIFFLPNDDGYVKFDDWEQGDREEHVDQIWDELQLNLEAQGARLGIEIQADDWLVRPTLNKRNHYLFYAYRTLWDGEPTINIDISKFDRRGYMEIGVALSEANATPEEVERHVQSILAMYTPETVHHYASFQDGDKIAAVGTVGVLAALAGVKYGKVAAAGILGVIIAFAKKLWFLLFLPIIWLWRRFKKDDDSNSGDQE